ncbi:hypothetical protein OG339_45330 [Streptosporangium sp. NBC_01495]|nr:MULTISPECIES: hypothetical protein [unclassified Streptosporangium]
MNLVDHHRTRPIGDEDSGIGLRRRSQRAVIQGEIRPLSSPIELPKQGGLARLPRSVDDHYPEGVEELLGMTGYTT